MQFFRSIDLHVVSLYQSKAFSYHVLVETQILLLEVGEPIVPKDLFLLLQADLP